jgi:hypothetical protein
MVFELKSAWCFLPRFSTKNIGYFSKMGKAFVFYVTKGTNITFPFVP